MIEGPENTIGGTVTETPAMIADCRDTLRWLAKRHDELAAAEAAKVPYWGHLPTSVVGHRAAAEALRADAALHEAVR